MEKPKASGRLLDVDEQAFRREFDRTSFMVKHQLADHPLFKFEKLFELVQARKENNKDIYFDMGDIKINQRWDQTPARSLSVEEAFNRLEQANAWIIIRHIQKDPAYLKILEDCMAEVEKLSGLDFKRFVKAKDAIFFLNSPGRVTPYHIDRECNILLQIRGDKYIYVFDKNDRTVITEEELERFWTVDNNAATYKEQHQNRSTEYLLKPGTGVHVPVGCPHWVKNGGGVSISLSINFHYRNFVKANLYRANYYMRKMGLKPTPPGKSKVGDAMKRGVIGGLTKARRMFKKESLYS
ncbi:MAG: transcriptional regulator [Pedosphaera sp.]|nr:transcriptional regulator [Pedosphaera sp.]